MTGVQTCALPISSIKDKDSILLVTEEKEICIENLQKDITFLKQESKRREAEAAVLGRQAAEKAFEEEREAFADYECERPDHKRSSSTSYFIGTRS